MIETTEQMREAVDRADEAAKSSPVTVYSWGLFYCSVCAPAEFGADEIERQTNRVLVCGTTKGWTVADQKFSDGSDNPAPCDSDPQRRHWLLAA